MIDTPNPPYASSEMLMESGLPPRSKSTPPSGSASSVDNAVPMEQKGSNASSSSNPAPGTPPNYLNMNFSSASQSSFALLPPSQLTAEPSSESVTPAQHVIPESETALARESIDGQSTGTNESSPYTLIPPANKSAPSRPHVVAPTKRLSGVRFDFKSTSVHEFEIDKSSDEQGGSDQGSGSQNGSDDGADEGVDLGNETHVASTESMTMVTEQLVETVSEETKVDIKGKGVVREVVNDSTIQANNAPVESTPPAQTQASQQAFSAVPSPATHYYDPHYQGYVSFGAQPNGAVVLPGPALATAPGYVPQQQYYYNAQQYGYYQHYPQHQMAYQQAPVQEAYQYQQPPASMDMHTQQLLATFPSVLKQPIQPVAPAPVVQGIIPPVQQATPTIPLADIVGQSTSLSSSPNKPASPLSHMSLPSVVPNLNLMTGETHSDEENPVLILAPPTSIPSPQPL